MPEGGALSTLCYTLCAALAGAIALKITGILPRVTPLADYAHRALTLIGWIHVGLCGVGMALVAFFRIREMLFEIPMPASCIAGHGSLEF